LPEPLRFESETCAPGWRLVKNIDGYGLGRKIHEAGWTFSWMPGQGPSGEGPRTIGCRLNQSTGLARGNELRREEMITLIKVERILNL
jgi:hypothetical protein